MGAKTWMLVHSSGSAGEALTRKPELDADATRNLARRAFPKEKLEPAGYGDPSYTCPPDDEVLGGSFPGVSILAAAEFAIDRPSRLPQRFLSMWGKGNLYLHAMHSVVDWLAFARWVDGELIRSLSLSPDRGVLEDFGEPLAFETPFGEGKHAASGYGVEGYPFPFHPLELGEAALKAFFNYQLEGYREAGVFEPEEMRLVKYRRARSWWRFGEVFLRGTAG